jgi:large subunit ribosomal protein L17
MKHQIRKGRKFGRTRDQRDALLSSLASSLLIRGKIVTTEAKAKELAQTIEPMITTAKANNVVARRMLRKQLPQLVVKKLVNEVAPRYAARPGGYTRITRLNPRERDNAHMATIELVE